MSAAADAGDVVKDAKMEPAELRDARKRLGLTQHGLAKALRMGKNGWQSVSRWEQDGNTIPGPVQVAVELLEGRVRLKAQIARAIYANVHHLMRETGTKAQKAYESAAESILAIRG